MSKPRLVEISKLKDSRGNLWKPDFSALSGATHSRIKDAYVTFSRASTLRGPHYQRHPHGQSKVFLVISGVMEFYCLEVNEDQTAGNSMKFTVNQAESVYVPVGWATASFAAEDSVYAAFMDYPYRPDYEVAMGREAVSVFLLGRSPRTSLKDS